MTNNKVIADSEPAQRDGECGLRMGVVCLSGIWAAVVEPVICHVRGVGVDDLYVAGVGMAVALFIASNVHKPDVKFEGWGSRSMPKNIAGVFVGAALSTGALLMTHNAVQSYIDSEFNHYYQVRNASEKNYAFNDARVFSSAIPHETRSVVHE